MNIYINQKGFFVIFQSKSIPLTTMNGFYPFLINDKYVDKTGNQKATMLPQDSQTIDTLSVNVRDNSDNKTVVFCSYKTKIYRYLLNYPTTKLHL